MTLRAPVNRILRSSIVDGPGNRAVVFLQGCNFDCRYCHNPETIGLCRSCGECLGVCPAAALSEEAGGIRWDREKCRLCDACIKACPHNASPRVRLMTAGEVLAEIEPSLPFIRGLTVSGGECTLYPGFLRDLGKLAADRGLSFFLDSNGSYDLLEDPELLELTGAVMLDLKADPDDPAEHRQVTGRDGWDILGRAEALARAGKLWELRTVVSPGLFDAAALVEKACRRLARIRGGFRYKLIRYRPNGVRSAEVANLAVPEEALMDGLTRICAAYGVEAVIL